VFRSFFLAVGQLADPAIRRVVWLSVALALALLAALVFGGSLLLAESRLVDWEWLDAIIDLLGVLGALFLAWLAFPATIGLVAGLFAERVANAVDRRHYPHLPPPRQQGIGETLSIAVRFAGVILAVNLLLAILSFLIPVLNLILLYAVNGYLLGREYFEMAAARRFDGAGMRALRRRHGGRVWLAGLAIALLLAIPLLNLLVPVVAVALMVHEVNRLGRLAPAP
jgi:uncharacterized protein involved in cysteine biosynthesis